MYMCPDNHPILHTLFVFVFLVFRYKDGDVICREGDLGNSMYIILEGQVKVMVDLGSKKKEGDDDDNNNNNNNSSESSIQQKRNRKKTEVHRYHRYGFFGELALLKPDGRRNADCIAVGGDVKCL